MLSYVLLLRLPFTGSLQIQTFQTDFAAEASFTQSVMCVCTTEKLLKAGNG